MPGQSAPEEAHSGPSSKRRKTQDGASSTSARDDAPQQRECARKVPLPRVSDAGSPASGFGGTSGGKGRPGRLDRGPTRTQADNYEQSDYQYDIKSTVSRRAPGKRSNQQKGGQQRARQQKSGQQRSSQQMSGQQRSSQQMNGHQRSDQSTRGQQGSSQQRSGNQQGQPERRREEKQPAGTGGTEERPERQREEKQRTCCRWWQFRMLVMTIFIAAGLALNPDMAPLKSLELALRGKPHGFKFTRMPAQGIRYHQVLGTISESQLPKWRPRHSSDEQTNVRVTVQLANQNQDHLAVCVLPVPEEVENQLKQLEKAEGDAESSHILAWKDASGLRCTDRKSIMLAPAGTDTVLFDDSIVIRNSIVINRTYVPPRGRLAVVIENQNLVETSKATSGWVQFSADLPWQRMAHACITKGPRILAATTSDLIKLPLSSISGLLSWGRWFVVSDRCLVHGKFERIMAAYANAIDEGEESFAVFNYLRDVKDIVAVSTKEEEAWNREGRGILRKFILQISRVESNKQFRQMYHLFAPQDAISCEKWTGLSFEEFMDCHVPDSAQGFDSFFLQIDNVVYINPLSFLIATTLRLIRCVWDLFTHGHMVIIGLVILSSWNESRFEHHVTLCDAAAIVLLGPKLHMLVGCNAVSLLLVYILSGLGGGAVGKLYSPMQSNGSRNERRQGVRRWINAQGYWRLDPSSRNRPCRPARVSRLRARWGALGMNAAFYALAPNGMTVAFANPVVFFVVHFFMQILICADSKSEVEIKCEIASCVGAALSGYLCVLGLSSL